MIDKFTIWNWKKDLKSDSHRPKNLFLKMFKFLSSLVGHAEKRHDEEDQINFKIYEATNWLINNYNTHFAQYLTN